MSKKDKDWTFVNDDGSLQPENDQASCSSSSNGSKKDSDSEQEFEVLAKPTNSETTIGSLMNFRGIFIKEDHFGDEIQDNDSDIEVLNKTTKDKGNQCTMNDSDGKESIEILESGFDNTDLLDAASTESDNDFIAVPNVRIYDEVSTDSDYEKVQNFGEEEQNETDEAEKFKMEGRHNTTLKDVVEDPESDNEYDGLLQLFETKDQVEEGNVEDISALIERLVKDIDEPDNNEYANEMRVTDDGIVLSTSMFIILLCLSVFAGLFIGKGMTCLSQIYKLEQPIVTTQAKPEATAFKRANVTNPEVIVFVNNSVYKMNYSTVWASKYAGFKDHDIRLAYQEMQLKYHHLQQKYQNLNEQYHITKKVMLFSKKMRNFEATKRQTDNSKTKENESQSNTAKELLWWKMRAAVWRQKYLNLKVKFLDVQKNLSMAKEQNVTFKTCARLLTRYVPDLNVAASETSDRIANGAKMCWRKVLSPVNAVREQMGTGLFTFSRSVDRFWDEMRSKWDKSTWDRNTWHKANENEDVRGKAASKWRKFRKMFAMSNIVGSLGWRKNPKGMLRSNEEAENKVRSEKEYCKIKSNGVLKEFIDRWSHDAKIKAEEISYLPPELEQDNKMASANVEKAEHEKDNMENEDTSPETNGTESFETEPTEGSRKNKNLVFVNRRGSDVFKPCTKSDEPSSRQASEKEAKLKQRFEDFENIIRRQSNRRREKEKDFKDKMAEFETYQNKKQEEIQKKREILEKKMRYHSNKKRNERAELKRKEEKMERIIGRLQRKFEKIVAKQVKMLERKKRRIEKKLKQSIRKNEKEKRKLGKEKERFRSKMWKIEQKMKNSEEELNARKEEFEKWSKEMTGRLAREQSENFNRQYTEQKKWERKKEKAVRKINDKIQREKDKLERKKYAMNLKIEQLKSALRKLLQEENQKAEEIKKKDDELRMRHSQVEMIKLYYAGSLQQEKIKQEEAKQLVWQMKQRVIKLKEVHDEILKKYKVIQEKLSEERQKLKMEEVKREQFTFYYPKVYCPDQNYCHGLNVKGESYAKVTSDGANEPNVVFCPKKDFCSGYGGLQQQFEEVYKMFDRKNWQRENQQEEVTVPRQKTALRPVPPKSHQLAKTNPFFVDLPTNANETAQVKEPKQQQTTTATPKPEQGKKQHAKWYYSTASNSEQGEKSEGKWCSSRASKPDHSEKQDGKWYFHLMKERAKQRAVPWSWYLYWSQGRKSWRTAPGKSENDNWYLKFMQERERQRESPVDWYFKRGKGKEEEIFNGKPNWVLDRAKGREDARKKEGFYYCW